MDSVQIKVNTKIGPVYLVASNNGLRGIFWKKQNAIPSLVNATDAMKKILQHAEMEIHQYLEGKRNSFTVKLDPRGTSFQMRVWELLKTIPYGSTCSYKQIAKQLNDPNASRAVGTANGKNPLSLIVPCHRVITSSGRLGGYAGGLSIKERLLRLEKTGSLD